MEEQIENILIKVDEGRMPVQQALTELLRLFNASGLLCPNCNAKGYRTTLTKNSYACKKCRTWWAN